jgi:hypothetical protein
MYDIPGNVTTPWLITGTNYSEGVSPIETYVNRISYANTTATTVDTNFTYASVSGYTQVGTTRPLMVIGTRSGTGNPIGWQKGGNVGADGFGNLSPGFVYLASTVNGFTVTAYIRQTYGTPTTPPDPSICDLYILLGHPNWNSTFGIINNFSNTDTNSNGGYLYTSGPGVKNILAITTLLSKQNGVQVTNAECQTVIDNIVNRVRLYFGFSGSNPAPTDPPTSTPNSTAFSFTGTTQTFTVPSNVYWLKVTARGAGGGHGMGDSNTAQNGGNGGEVVGWVPVNPSEVYKVIVGGGGKGKGVSATGRYGGGGGGFSGLLNNSTNAHIISAGGGGGSQFKDPVTTGGLSLSISGGHTLVNNSSSAAGGSGGQANSTASSNSILNGSPGTSSGGGNGGTTWNVDTVLDAGGGGGGGGYGTSAGIGGDGSFGGSDNLTGKGGDGGFGGGGGGGGGGTGGSNERTNPGGGGGGGYIGGQGGLNTPTFNWRAGQGGYNFLYWSSNSRGGTTAPLVSTTSGGGSAGATVSGNDGTNGSVLIQYATQ